MSRFFEKDGVLYRQLGTTEGGSLKAVPMRSLGENRCAPEMGAKPISIEGEVRHIEEPMVEVRAGGVQADKPGVFRGYAAVFNSPSEEMWGFREFIAPGAFDDVLGDDVRVRANHSNDLLLGRTANGTARIGVDNIGLWYEADDPDTSYSRDWRKLIERGDVNQSSFAFTVAEEQWNEDYENEVYTRTIVKVKRLYDVAPVTIPAYPAATVTYKGADEQDEQKNDNSQNEEGFQRLRVLQMINSLEEQKLNL